MCVCWKWGKGVPLNTLRPDRINYSDVSICQQGLVPQPEHPDHYRAEGNGDESLHSSLPFPLSPQRKRGMERREAKMRHM